MTEMVDDRVQTLHGRVTGVVPKYDGDEASVAASIGDVEVTVGDGSHFDEEGGWCRIGDTVYGYDSMTYVGDAADDGDPAVLALTTALTAAVAVGDRVDAWDPLVANGVGGPVVEYVGTLAQDSTDIGGDPLKASVDHKLVPLLEEGIRSEGYESVELERDGDDLRVVRPLGKAAIVNAEYVGSIHAKGYLPAMMPGLANDTWTRVTYTVTDAVGIVYDPVTSEFQVPVDGAYTILATARWQMNGTGSRAMQFQYDTAHGLATEAETRVAAVVGGDGTVMECVRTRTLAAGDKFYVEVLQTSGAGLTLGATDTKLVVFRSGT